MRPLNRFDKAVVRTHTDGLLAAPISTFQVNVGLRCNLKCHHCHVESSPKRREEMSLATMQRIVELAKSHRLKTIDITGGAPELHPHLRQFITELKNQGQHVIVRTNLTVLLLKPQHDYPEFFRDHEVELVASLPCYLEDNVNGQRGNGVYQRSVEVIQMLNRLGYGRQENLPLKLVYNPTGPFLPPAQKGLEEDYRRELKERFDIDFSELFTITNMPIGRFIDDLREQNADATYIELLERSFNPGTVDGLMCRHQVSIRWDGALFDCDFNLALQMPVHGDHSKHLDDFDAKHLVKRPIRTALHCFGCTAGSGSSCGGALV